MLLHSFTAYYLCDTVAAPESVLYLLKRSKYENGVKSMVQTPSAHAQHVIIIGTLHEKILK